MIQTKGHCPKLVLTNLGKQTSQLLKFWRRFPNKLFIDVVLHGCDAVAASNFLVIYLLHCFIFDSPGNYDLIDKFLGGSTARKCVFSKGESRNDVCDI